MPLLDWPFLDAFQTGALATLFMAFGMDALSRRDRMMGWLALTCLLVGLRHGVLALGAQTFLNPGLVEHVQSLLVLLGFLALCRSLAELFPRHVPRRFALWMALAMLPNFIRILAFPHSSLADTWAHHAANLTYVAGFGLILHWTLRARHDGDPMGRRLFLGFLGVTLPVMVEIAAFSLFGLKIRLSGFSLLILAVAIGTSWQGMVVEAMDTRLHQAEDEGEAWQSLLPGMAFRSDRPSPQMEALFGPAWVDLVQDRPESLRVARDGLTYHIRCLGTEGGTWFGCCERTEASPPSQAFLSGWTVGLGLDQPEERERIQTLLQAWGAEVEPWATVPPREGPYPSLLLWGREPSILSVWREGGMRRRRCRWIQIGGPLTEGPHGRLEPGASGETLKQLLEGLLSRP